MADVSVCRPAGARGPFRCRAWSVVGALVGALAAPLPSMAQGAGGVVQGITQAQRDLKLGLPVAGRVEGLFVREGDRVKVGQLMLHLDRTLEELEVRRRQLQLRDDSRLVELRARERVLSEQVANLRPLVEAGSAPRKQLEDEELALGAVAGERRALEAAKQREQVELELAMETFERRHLRAPIDGVVTKIVHRPGESVAPNEVTMHLVDVGKVRFLGTMSWQAAPRLRPGAPVALRIGAEEGGRARQGRVVFVAPVADPASGLVEVIAEFDNADGSLRPGVSARISY